MKHTLLLLSLLIAQSSFADSISAKGADWRDISRALNITPFYLTIKSSIKATQINLIAEVYNNQEMIYTFQSGGIGIQEPKPLVFNSALFFKEAAANDDSYELTWTVDWANVESTTKKEISRKLINLKGFSFSASQALEKADTKSLIATIICDSEGGFTMNPEIEKTIADNPTATVIGLYIEYE